MSRAFAHKSKASPSKKKKKSYSSLEDSILIIVCLPYRSYFLTGCELGWGGREVFTERPRGTAQKSMWVVL